MKYIWTEDEQLEAGELQAVYDVSGSEAAAGAA
jgi:hypothetical protein